MKKIFQISSTVIILISVLLLPLMAYSLELETSSNLLGNIYSRTISMDFSNANLNDVLKIFSQQSGMNFIAETDVANKRVNLYFEKVPVEEALERILSANNLTYELKPGSNIFVVKDRKQPDRELMSRIYELNHIVLPSSNLVASLAETTIIASLDNGLLPALQSLLSEEGSLTQDPRTNSLIINDYPSQFPEIEKAIARLDIRIPQILIEAEILDVSEGAVDEIGAKFSSTLVSIDGPQKQILWPFNRDNVLDDAGDDGFSFGSEGYTAGSINIPSNLLTLQFLKTHSETKNLARPRILTMNNQTAEIVITTNEVIGLTSEANSDTISYEAEREETGVSLKVTPQANLRTGEITLAVLPENTTTKTSRFTTSGDQTFKDPETQSTKSIFRVTDGGTVIIGGLLRNTISGTETKVPILGDIPFLGRAFKHNSNDELQRELLVFITPSIVKDSLVEEDSYDEDSDLFLNLVREQNSPINDNTNNNDTYSYFNN